MMSKNGSEEMSLLMLTCLVGGLLGMTIGESCTRNGSIDPTYTAGGSPAPWTVLTSEVEGLPKDALMRLQDPGTRCEYIFINRVGITPRLTTTGVPYCRPPEKK